MAVTPLAPWRAASPLRRAEPLTVHRHPQEELVGDVDHGAAQQAEDVHAVQVLQVVQVRLRGGAAHLHGPLHGRAGQSCHRGVTLGAVTCFEICHSVTFFGVQNMKRSHLCRNKCESFSTP